MGFCIPLATICEDQASFIICKLINSFSKLYDFAVELIKANKAYVCDLNPEEIRQYRGTLTESGRNSPYRDRPYEENLNLLERMRAGEFDEGARVLRAKINMASGNLNMRDPVLYRIMKPSHHRTQDNWCIYPTYDFAHGQSDSIEGVTHSICTTEFEDHRPLYDWILDQLGIFHPQQIEFARLNISNTMMSKRKLADLVEDGEVTGWNDPRMPTLTAMRRRGYTPEAVRTFCTRVGVAKRQNVVEMALLEHLVREDLNIKSRRVMAVLRPIRVVIENYPKDQVEELDAINNPEDPSMGSRKLPFSRELYIEEDDFQEDPPKKYFRLAPGREVRLRYGYFITCVGVIKNQIGDIVELRCTYDPQSRGGQAPDGRKVKGTIHWVSAKHAQRVEVRLYEYLFKSAESDGKIELISNPNSLETLRDCMAEPSLIDATPGHRFQFERLGYFCVDTEDSSPTSLVFNRTVTLSDTWSKIQHR